MPLGSKDGFNIWFDCASQIYFVYKWGSLITSGQTKYSEVKCYIL